MSHRLNIYINEARQIVLRLQLPDRCRDKLSDVKIDAIDRNKNNHLKKFGREYQKLIRQTVAFYDPNENVIFINKKKIITLPDNQVREILVHEFIHAISNHSAKKDKRQVILYSGLKKQTFSKFGNTTQFQSLNEGYVQYLCNNLLGYASQTYFHDYQFVKLVIGLIGEQSVFNAFIYNNVTDFELQIDHYVSAKQFSLACSYLDDGHYPRALDILKNIKQPQSSPEYAYTLATD